VGSFPQARAGVVLRGYICSKPLCVPSSFGNFYRSTSAICFALTDLQGRKNCLPVDTNLPHPRYLNFSSSSHLQRPVFCFPCFVHRKPGDKSNRLWEAQVDYPLSFLRRQISFSPESNKGYGGWLHQSMMNRLAQRLFTSGTSPFKSTNPRPSSTFPTPTKERTAARGGHGLH
jgi:hypothetical protein